MRGLNLFFWSTQHTNSIVALPWSKVLGGPLYMRKVVPLLAKSVKYDVCGTKGLPDSSIAPFVYCLTT